MCLSTAPKRDDKQSHCQKKVSWCKEAHRQRASIPAPSQFPLVPLLAAAGYKSWSLGGKLKARKHKSSKDGSSKFYTNKGSALSFLCPAKTSRGLECVPKRFMCWEPGPQHGKIRGGGTFQRVRFSGWSKDWSLPMVLQPHLSLLPFQVPATVMPSALW